MVLETLFWNGLATLLNPPFTMLGNPPLIPTEICVKSIANASAFRLPVASVNRVINNTNRFTKVIDKLLLTMICKLDSVRQHYRMVLYLRSITMSKFLRHMSAIIILASVAPASAQVIYVKAGATGSGASWSDPEGSLQNAVNSVGAGGQVWVALRNLHAGTKPERYIHACRSSVGCRWLFWHAGY